MGFLINALGLGGGNDFKAQQANLANTDYNSQLQNLLQGGALNQVDFGNSNGVNQNQNALVAALQQRMAGAVPSVAQNQLNATTNQNIQQGAGAIASQHGINPALQARLILQNQAAQNQQAAGQGALLRAQEQQGATGQLGDVLSGQRGQDIQQSLGQVQAGLQQVQGLGTLQNQQNQNAITNQQGADKINAQVSEENAKRGGGLLGGALGAVGSALTGGITGGVLGNLLGTSKEEPKYGPGFSKGGIVPGNAPLTSDSPVNDTVPAMLSPGEIVVPKSKASSPERAKEFIEAVKRHNEEESKASEEPNFGKVIAAQRMLHGRLQQLEALCYGGMAGGR